jgi:hypothetical protein
VFTVFNGLIYAGMPDLNRLGLRPIAQMNPSVHKTEVQVRHFARQIAAHGLPCYLDEVPGYESMLHSDPRVADPAVDDLSRICDWMHEAAPGLRLGPYYTYPYWPVLGHRMQVDKGQGAGETLRAVEGMQQAFARMRDRLGPHVDFICPCLYRFAGENYPFPHWKIWAEATLEQAAKWHKAVYPFLWPEMHNDGKAEQTGRMVPADEWRQMLEFCYERRQTRNVLGVVVWGGWGANNAPQQWDENAPWVRETLGFVRRILDDRARAAPAPRPAGRPATLPAAPPPPR